MTKLTKTELELAKNMVLWHASSTGESSTKSMAATTGLQAKDLYAWAISMGFVIEGEDYTPLAMFPFIWRDFADESRTCLSLYTALKALMATDKKVASWVAGCREELERDIKRYG